jgi:hypothetical protein
LGHVPWLVEFSNGEKMYGFILVLFENVGNEA